jgi:hypothetical protein
MQSDAYSKCGKNSEKVALVFGCGICDGLKASQSREEKGARAGQAFFRESQQNLTQYCCVFEMFSPDCC